MFRSCTSTGESRVEEALNTRWTTSPSLRKFRSTGSTRSSTQTSLWPGQQSSVLLLTLTRARDEATFLKYRYLNHAHVCFVDSMKQISEVEEKPSCRPHHHRHRVDMQSTIGFFASRPNWDPPPPYSQTSVSPPTLVPEGICTLWLPPSWSVESSFKDDITIILFFGDSFRKGSRKLHPI